MKLASLLVLAVACTMTFPVVGGEATESLAQEVRAAETAFAKTMANRDLQAFLTYVASDAVFFGHDRTQRGVEAVKAAWSPFFKGEKAPFSWKPEVVEVLDTGNLAFSSGPVLDPQGRRVGTFNSVWRREATGKWKVVFDKGCPACDCSGKPVAGEESP